MTYNLQAFIQFEITQFLIVSGWQLSLNVIGKPYCLTLQSKFVLSEIWVEWHKCVSKMDNPILNEKHLFFSQALSKYEKHFGKTFALQLCRTPVKFNAPLSTIVDHHHMRRLSWKRNTWNSISHELQPRDLKHKPACRWTLYSTFM